MIVSPIRGMEQFWMARVAISLAGNTHGIHRTERAILLLARPFLRRSRTGIISPTIAITLTGPIGNCGTDVGGAGELVEEEEP